MKADVCQSHAGPHAAPYAGPHPAPAGPLADRPRLQFALANLRALVTGGLFLRDGHRPSTGHLVPADFCGVGVATAAPPAMDGVLIEHLRALGVRQLRLDFTYGDADGPAGRFLEALCSNGFDVMLHLVQPPSAARDMPAAVAVDAWQAFVSATLERFGQRVILIEACSTLNRRRWAGYHLHGGLAAWAVVRAETRARGLILGGPGVTDFEPLWTLGMLAILKQRQQLPDIHTDNLFAERSTEPERWDHKILGPLLAPLLRFNLIKKARVLARCGSAAGVPRLISPAAFWTLPRIERLLPDSEQKQADYLARYLLLCAASGVLERACWGPLVCHREGLIDEGPHPYPALERITHYAGIDGDIDALRRRPAFAALAAFNKLIPGSRYGGRLNHGEGLEIHLFTTPTAVMHAVWTPNGGAAAACDLYTDTDLAASRAFDRDGHPLADTPTLFSETPLYLCWPANHPVSVSPQARPLAGVRLHRHATLNHYYHRNAAWHGIVRAGSRAEADTLIAALDPQHLTPPAKHQALRHARNAIWTIAHPLDRDRQLVVKKPVKHHFHKRILDRLKPSKALRSWNGASELQRRGLTTPAPVAWIEQRGNVDITRNWYVCDYVAGNQSVSTLFSHFSAGKSHPSGITPTTLYPALAAFILKLHGRGVYFRDLSGGNILVRDAGPDGLSFDLIDTARLRAREDGTPMRKRLADLSRMCYKLSPEARADFMQHYLHPLGRRYSALMRLRFRLYAFKAAIKRSLRRTDFYKRLKR